MYMERIFDVRRLFNSISDIWLLVDVQGSVLLASKHTEKFPGLSKPIREGDCIFESIPERWRGIASNVLETLPHATLPTILEAGYTWPNNRETHYKIKCTGIRDDDGVLRHVFVEARDLTAEKIFEKKITIVARDYQSVIENANAVIIGTDVRGYITEWNDTARQVTGFSKNESYIRTFTDFVDDDMLESFTEAMKNVWAGRVTTNLELAMKAKDGRKLMLLINGTPRLNATGEVIGALLIGQDITELSAYRQSLEKKVRERTHALKSALEKERQLVEVKDRFVSMASHEFRSPISYIHRNIGTIRDHIDTMDPSEVRERLRKIQSHAEHLTSLLEDVLSIGKTGANTNRIQANLSTVDLKDFLDRIIDEVQTNTHHTHRIALQFPSPTFHLHSDENLLRNIFVNLLTNAIKFSPGKEIVDVAVDKCAQDIKVSIRDYGLGIDETDLPRIFEPFHRGQNVQTIKGTGLGLPIVRKAVDTLGGEVAVESKAGSGTLFTVKLNLHNT